MNRKDYQLFAAIVFILTTNNMLISSASAHTLPPIPIGDHTGELHEGSRDFKISHDGNTVVYTAYDLKLDGTASLFSTSIDGALTARQLSQSLDFGMGISRFQISPDGSRVVYMVSDYSIDSDRSNEIYSVKIDGRGLVKLNHTLPAGENIQPDFQITPDSAYVLYRGNEHGADLFKVPLTGGQPVKLNPDRGIQFQGFQDIVEYKISPDGQFAVYLSRASLYTPNSFNLFSVSLNDGTVSQLNLGGRVDSDGITRDGSHLGYSKFSISPDSRLVLFLDDLLVKGKDELFSTAISGGNVTKISNNTVVGHFDSDIRSIRISHDSAKVVYFARTAYPQLELFSSPINGQGETIKLNSAVPVGGALFPGHFTISSDSTFVVYHADLDTPYQFEVYATPLTGGASIKLNSEFVAEGDSFSSKISQNSQITVYYADQEQDSPTNIYSVPTSGGNAQKISSISDGYISSTQITPDSEYIIYSAQEPGQSGLYITPIQGGRTHSIYTTPFSANAKTYNEKTYEVTDNGRYIIYLRNRRLFATRIIAASNSMCFPILSFTGNLVTICL